MKSLFLVLALIPTIAIATGGTKPVPPIKTVNKSVSVNQTVNPSFHDETNVTAGATAQSVGGNGGSVTITNPASRLAVAPDIITYPTAPCRVSIGVSGGWIGGAVGASGSVEDENCQRIETSRHLHNLGQKEAAVQVMCLSADAYKAISAVGVKCLLKPVVPAETVKP